MIPGPKLLMSPPSNFDAADVESQSAVHARGNAPLATLPLVGFVILWRWSISQLRKLANPREKLRNQSLTIGKVPPIL